MVAIRQATITDLPQLIALDQAIFGVYGADESPTVIAARLQAFPAGCAVLEESAPVGEEPHLLGYLTTEKWDTLREPALDEDPQLTHRPTGVILNITTLAIAPQHQKRGLGRQLLAHALIVAQREGCTALVLETARAENFYKNYDFVKIGERYQRGILLHIMYYSLTKT